jgi:hypothetical protein
MKSCSEGITTPCSLLKVNHHCKQSILPVSLVYFLAYSRPCKAVGYVFKTLVDFQGLHGHYVPNIELFLMKSDEPAELGIKGMIPCS